MAQLVAIANGNFTTGTTWGVVVSSMLSSTAAGTALTTGNLDSAVFQPGAITCIGLCVRVYIRGAAAATNKMTITLRNSTGAIDVASVTVNVSDIPVSATGADSEGGWLFLKFSAAQLLIVATDYVVRATLDSTSTAVQLATDGTANNWQRLIVGSTTQVPIAADDLHIGATFDGATNPATVTARTVTMDETVATDYGTAVTNRYQSALEISTGGTLTWATNIAGLLRLSGQLKVYRGGTYNQGTVATPIAIGSSGQLEFDNAADGNFGLLVMDGGTCVLQGSPRTAGKLIEQTVLTANLAAAGVQSTVADDTGWLNGDEIGLAVTSRTSTEIDAVALSGAAGATTLDHAAVTFAHLGSVAEKAQAEVVLLTRNCLVKSVSTSFMSFVRVLPTASLTAAWTLFRYCGTGASTTAGLTLETTTGVVSLSYCVMRDSDGGMYRYEGLMAGGSISITHCVGFKWGVVTTSYGLSFNATTGSTGTIAIDFVTLIGGAAASNTAVRWDGTGDGPIVTIGTLRVCGCTSSGILWISTRTDCIGHKFGPIHTHSNAFAGLNFSTSVRNARFDSVYAWRNGTSGISFIAEIAASGLAAVFGSIWFEGTTGCFGNTTSGVNVQGALHDVRFADLRCHGDSSFAQALGMRLIGPISGRIEKADFSTASGILVANTTADIGTASPGPGHVDLVIDDALTAGTEIDTALAITGLTGGYTLGSRISYQRHDRVATEHRTLTPLGNLLYETTTVDVSPSLKMTPKHATLKLQSNAQQRNRGFLVPVANAASITVTVKVQKDGSYNGAAPRLLCLANPSIGIDETVMDTLSIGSGSFETLTGTVGPASDAGVLEFVCDCDGTAGNIFLDTWTAS